MSGRGPTGRERPAPKLRDIRAIRDASILRLWRGWDEERRAPKAPVPRRERRGPRR